MSEGGQPQYIVTRWNWAGLPYEGRHWKEAGIDAPPTVFAREVDARIAALLLMKVSGVLFVIERVGDYHLDLEQYRKALFLERHMGDS